jgi:hypothetical protein
MATIVTTDNLDDLSLASIRGIAWQPLRVVKPGLVSQLSIIVIQWTCGHGPALRRWELQDGRYDGSLRPDPRCRL